jgi:ketosteroid isomerase-like protein
MSRENVEIVRRVMEAEARGDETTIFAHYDEDILWDVSGAGGPVAGIVDTFRGHEGVRSWLRTWYEGFKDVTYEIDELADAGEHVLLALTMKGKGRASGADVTTRLYGAWTLRERKVVRVAWFQSRDEALEAVGLWE